MGRFVDGDCATIDAIGLKSANETKYWLCLLRDGFDEKGAVLGSLLKEANDLSKILAASILKLRKQ